MLNSCDEATNKMLHTRLQHNIIQQDIKISQTFGVLIFPQNAVTNSMPKLITTLTVELE